MDNADRDQIWLFDRMAQAGIEPTDAQLEAFAEKVADICADRQMAEDDARLLAYEVLL